MDWVIFKYYKQRLIMTLHGNAALLLFYILLLAYIYVSE
jgi:hypothetical protein